MDGGSALYKQHMEDGWRISIVQTAYGRWMEDQHCTNSIWKMDGGSALYKQHMEDG